MAYIDTVVKQIVSAEEVTEENIRAFLEKSATDTIGKLVPPSAVAQAPIRIVTAGQEGKKGLNGYGLFSHEISIKKKAELGEEAGKAWFKQPGQTVSELWNAMSEAEKQAFNARAKEQKPVSVGTANVSPKTKTLWGRFQAAFATYATLEKLAVDIHNRSQLTSAKYQELGGKTKDTHLVEEFIAKYPPMPKVKKASPKKGVAVQQAAPISI